MESCYWPIEQLPGLSLNEIKSLKSYGICTTQDLLQQQDLTRLASQLVINRRYLHKWYILADLARIPAVGCTYCGLILHVGIVSLAQLAQTPVHRLQQQILRLYVQTMQRQDLCPSSALVQQWIQEAKLLHR